MKKLISILIAICMIATASLVFSGCDLSGSDAVTTPGDDITEDAGSASVGGEDSSADTTVVLGSDTTEASADSAPEDDPLPSDTTTVPESDPNDIYNNDMVSYEGDCLKRVDTSYEGALTIKPGTKEIAMYALSGCKKLTSVKIPNSVTKIGLNAFYRCESLKSIEIPDSVTEIGDYAFAQCLSLTSLTIPGSVVTIGRDAFASCKNLEEVTILEGTTWIGYAVFGSCEALTKINLPDSITYIGSDAFDQTAYYDNESNWENGVLYVSNHLIAVKKEFSGVLTVKAGTRSIAVYAAKNRSGVTSIIFPDSLTTINNCAFEYCRGITSITLPSSLTNIEKYAFYTCEKLSDVYYAGTEAQWAAIPYDVKTNDSLAKATIHYNHK